VTSEQWLARLLLRLGDSVEVVEPSAWSDVRSNAAEIVLRRYS
jgi:predicted DNA-binding transcriptional regulator YafY